MRRSSSVDSRYIPQRIVGIASNPLKIINNNSNATYNFGGEVVNKNSVNIFVFSDGADYKTPDLVKKQVVSFS